MLTKVLIIGIRKQHLQKLQKEYGKVLEVSGLHDQDKHHRCVPHPEGYTKIISMIRFTNHSTQSIYGGFNSYQATRGSFSSVRNMLNTLL